MNLIAISNTDIGGSSIQTCNARDLHSFLGIVKPFTAWLEVQIERARLQDKRDYLYYQEVINPSGGRPRHECSLTLDAAKQIAMMSGGDKAFEVRDYFLECERKAQAKPAFDPAALSRMDILAMALDSEKGRIEAEVKVSALTLVVSEQAPKVDALNRIAVSEGSFNLREAAKVLQMKERDFIQYLHNKGWVYRSQLGGRWVAHAATLRQGYMEQKSTTGLRDDGTEWTSSQAKITPKGLTRLAIMLGIDLNLGGQAA